MTFDINRFDEESFNADRFSAVRFGLGGFMSDVFTGTNGTTILGRKPLTNNLGNLWASNPGLSPGGDAEIQSNRATFNTSGNPGQGRGNVNFITPLDDVFHLRSKFHVPVFDAVLNFIVVAFDSVSGNIVGANVRDILGTMSLEAFEVVGGPPASIGTPVAVNVGSDSEFSLKYDKGQMTLIVDGGAPQSLSSTASPSDWDCAHFDGVDDNATLAGLVDIRLSQ